MKLVLAIVNRDDSSAVVQNLSRSGFYCTKLATSGGFLISNNITLLTGVDDEKVDQVISIIREYSHSRRQMIPSTHIDFDFDTSVPLEVTVGGATIFVLDVTRFEKV